MLIKILIVVVVVAIVFIVIVAKRPSTFRVTRSATIPASVAFVFGYINDLHKWQTWSPWAKMDPNAKITFEGPPAGVGASFAWAGSSKIGEGRMTELESVPNERVRFRLEFKKPFSATNEVEFILEPKGDQTLVEWIMTGRQSFVFKAVGLFMDTDKMCGDQFEQGFANLKSVVGSTTKP